MSRRGRAGAATLGLLMGVAPGVAAAQDGSVDAAFAETLRRATAALQRGAFPEALDLCERALRVRSTVSVRYCLAVSHDRLDHPVEAYVEAGNCLRELPDEADTRRRRFLETRCVDIGQRRRVQVARAQIELAGAAPPGLQITVNGRPVPNSVLGLPLPVREGSVTVQAGAEGYEDFAETVTIAPEQTRTVSLRMRRVVVPATPMAPVAPVTPAVEVRRRGWEAVLGGALVAGGLTALGFGVYNLGVHGTEVSDTGTYTIRQACAFGASQSAGQCEGIGVATPLLLGVGAAAVGVGVFLLYDGLRARAVGRSALRPELTIGHRGASVGVSGAF